ncbi:UDP-N-acetylglucosamine transferase subunit [Loxospora ochrophaea]|nr:UDP-N-acetylglucosamine transferase subunit [Loxospora ochrophaea]
MLSPAYLLALTLTTLTLLFLRLLYTLPSTNPTSPTPRKRGSQPTRLLIVLGSGGHTAEMLSLLPNLPTTSYTHRTYVISSGDAFSALKAAEFERHLFARAEQGLHLPSTAIKTQNNNSLTPAETQRAYGSYDICVVPRARSIHQPLLTTPLSSLRCFMRCLSILHSPSSLTPTPSPNSSLTATDYYLSFLPASIFSNPSKNATLFTYPDLILTNGPATATILILSAVFLRFVGLRGTKGKMRSVYVESWARVKGLSLSGRVLVGGGLCERVVVQWPAVKGWGLGRVEYRGCLVR